MKKIFKGLLVTSLSLMMVLMTAFSQTQEVRAESNLGTDSEGYLINQGWNTVAQIGFKLRSKHNYFEKGQQSIKFIILGSGKVEIGSEGTALEDKWTWDDYYEIQLFDRGNNKVSTRKLYPGGTVKDDLKEYRDYFNSNSGSKVGYTIKLSAVYGDTITPHNGYEQRLYLAKPKGRTNYEFTFTNEGLVEEAKNLKGQDSAQSAILIPVSEYGRSYNDLIYVNVDKQGNVSFRSNYINRGATMDVRGTIGTSKSPHYTTGMDRGVNASRQFGTIAYWLTQHQLKYGDYLHFSFKEYGVTPRLGKNLYGLGKGYYNLTNDSGPIKLTRYGFLTGDGYLVKYAAAVEV